MNRSQSKDIAHNTGPYLQRGDAQSIPWRAFGREAFAEAQERDCPVWVHVGMLTSAGCRAMDQVCLDDPSLGALVAAQYVCVRVDRNLSPAVDVALSAATAQLCHGEIGWPQNIFLTPDGRPFFAGTFFDAEADPDGRPSWGQILGRVRKAWLESRSEIEDAATRLVEMIQATAEPSLPQQVDEAMVEAGHRQLRQTFDHSSGGFGDAPKFFPFAACRLLLQLSGDALAEPAQKAQALKMVKATMDGAMQGGLIEAAGPRAGFFRWSAQKDFGEPAAEQDLAELGEGPCLLLKLEDERYHTAAANMLQAVLDHWRTADGTFAVSRGWDEDGLELVDPTVRCAPNARIISALCLGHQVLAAQAENSGLAAACLPAALTAANVLAGDIEPFRTTLADSGAWALACLDLFKVTAEAIWLERAAAEVAYALGRWGDIEDGGIAGIEGPVALLPWAPRWRNGRDDGMLSGIAMLAEALLRLHGESAAPSLPNSNAFEPYLAWLESILESQSAAMKAEPAAHAGLLWVLAEFSKDWSDRLVVKGLAKKEGPCNVPQSQEGPCNVPEGWPMRRLTPSGPQASRIAFSALRCGEKEGPCNVPLHCNVPLQLAVSRGCRLVVVADEDGSGDAERMVGTTLSRLWRENKDLLPCLQPSSKDDLALPWPSRKEMSLVVEVGPVRGEMLKEVRAKIRKSGAGKPPFGEMLEIDGNAWHSADPAFLAWSLAKTRKRLRVHALDRVLLAYPEAMLRVWQSQGQRSEGDAPPQPHADFAQATERLGKTLTAAFEFLETEVKAGRLGGYGLVSDTLGMPAPLGLSLTHVDRWAQKAMGSGNAHHCDLIKVPLNLLESDVAIEPVEGEALPGLPSPTLLAQAQSLGMGVLAMRPLQAQGADRWIRLAKAQDFPGDSAKNLTEDGLQQKLAPLIELEKELAEKLNFEVTVGGKQSMPVASLFSWGGDLKAVFPDVATIPHFQDLCADVLQPRWDRQLEFLDHQLPQQFSEVWQADRAQYIEAVNGALGIGETWVKGREGSRLESLQRRIAPYLPASMTEASLSEQALWTAANIEGVASVCIGMRKAAYVEAAHRVAVQLRDLDEEESNAAASRVLHAAAGNR